MSRGWKLMKDIEQCIEEVSVEDLQKAAEILRRNAALWPKYAKLAMKDVLRIEREIEKRQNEQQQN